MESENIKIEIEKNVATMALARADKLNALSIDFAEEITKAVQSLTDNDDVRVIIIKSDARIFCAGLDLKAVATIGMDRSAKQTLRFKEMFHYLFECCNILEKCPKPIISAVHDKCVGGGLDIITASDIRMCTEDAGFSLREAALGIVADMGVLQRLPHIIGQGFTREMAYTARFFTAKEVERMGLINYIYPDKEALMKGARELAAQIAELPPLAVQETKKTLNYSRDSTIKDGMNDSMQKNISLLFSADTIEAMAAFIEKRKPEFKGE